MPLCAEGFCWVVGVWVAGGEEQRASWASRSQHLIGEDLGRMCVGRPQSKAGKLQGLKPIFCQMQNQEPNSFWHMIL